MKGDKWPTFSTFLTRVQKVQVKIGIICLLLAIGGLTSRGFTGHSYEENSWAKKASYYLLEVNEIFHSEIRQASILSCSSA